MRNRVLLSAFFSVAENDKERLLELCSFVEGAFHREHKHRMSIAEDTLRQADDESKRQFLVECYAEDFFEIENEFPKIQRYAMFSSAMSMWEATFIGLCRACFRIFGFQKEFNSRGNDVVIRAIDYVVRNLGIDVTPLSYYISQADKLRHVRNCIVHDNGDVSRRKGEEIIKIWGLVVSTPTIGIDNHFRLVLNNGFVQNCCIHEMFLLVHRLHEIVEFRVRELQSA